VDAGFDVCWSCGTSKEGEEDPTFVREDEAEVASDAAHDEPDLADSSPPVFPARLSCLRCHGEMEEGFVADFRDPISRYPIRWFPGPPVRSLLVGTTSEGGPRVVRTYRCARCGYLESYAEPDA
jgi:hypothetical protein